ncbi:hypothetical protein [uncultured Pontibacter sp.]|uniref:hypothetical protein n=1 Tax=uncultured Pontibacter sp. TaxID=453356 RepID=UPI0026336594|nr:hypothetical protein [uncultured Pontibacter sp.]
MNNLEALQLIRKSIQEEIDRNNWGFILRPLKVNSECSTWIKAKDVTSKEVENVSCSLIENGRFIKPAGNGDLDDIESRIHTALSRLWNYAQECELTNNPKAPFSKLKVANVNFRHSQSDPLKNVCELGVHSQWIGEVRTNQKYLDFISLMSRNYLVFLNSIQWDNTLFMNGVKEGLNKFLSNYFIFNTKGYKYHKTHFVSQEALSLLETGAKDLVFEHMVPKRKHLQHDLEKLAKEGKLTEETIKESLLSYWYCATITKEENKRLTMHSMPSNWNSSNIFTRYEIAEITLIPNPYFSGIYLHAPTAN